MDDVDYFLSPKLTYTNFWRWKIMTTTYLKACDLWDVVGEEPLDGMSNRVREKKEEKAFAVLKKAVHEEVWIEIGEKNSPREVWLSLDPIISKNRDVVLPIEYWVKCVELDEVNVKEIDGDEKHGENSIVNDDEGCAKDLEREDEEDTYDEEESKKVIDEEFSQLLVEHGVQQDKVEKKIKESTLEEESWIDVEDEIMVIGSKSVFENEEDESVGTYVNMDFLGMFADFFNEELDFNLLSLDDFHKNSSNPFIMENGHGGNNVLCDVGDDHMEILTKDIDHMKYVQYGLENSMVDTGWVNMEVFFDRHELMRKKYTKFIVGQDRLRAYVKKKQIDKVIVLFMLAKKHHAFKKAKIKRFTSLEMALATIAIEGGGPHVDTKFFSDLEDDEDYLTQRH